MITFGTIDYRNFNCLKKQQNFKGTLLTKKVIHTLLQKCKIIYIHVLKLDSNVSKSNF